MRLSRLIILALMAGVFSAVGGYYLMDTYEEEEEIATSTKPSTGADLSLQDIHYVETKGERTEWELRAKSAQHFRRDDYTRLQDLTVTFYDENGKTITLKGDNGSMKGRKEIEVWGNVIITSSDGYRILTNSLYYDENKRQITTHDPVIIEGKKLRLKGVGVVVDVKGKRLSILKNVETVLEG